MRSRPVGARMVSYVAGGCLVAIFLAIAFFLPEDIRSTVTPSQTGTLVLVLLAALAVLNGIARSSVHTEADGIHVRNGYRTRVVGWDEVEGVSYRTGAPWATLARRDGDTHMLIAIQGTDGERAAQAVRDLRAEIAAHQA
ncbi:PH domain-containing protein [Solicola sp. PLA-1-18]|uniref:PH domain-containing protein n=1 Tax=Solicola sp. PLA-1-18 TaxID=3380532 RepID=UPI003B77030A